MWMVVFTWGLHGRNAGATECDEPEQQNASGQLAIDVITPAVAGEVQ